jgi:GNAT superfamily N-acetyltransferase
MIEVVEIDPRRRRDRAAFTGVPFRLAQHDPAWHPGIRRMHEDLIDPRRYGFWKRHPGSFFVARRGREIVGRIAVVDPGQVADEPGAAVVAFPDFIDDRAVVDQLMSAVLGRARARGATAVLGPLNPDMHHDVGLLVDGPPRRNFAFMGHQPRYYSEHFERLGFQRLADFEAWGLRRDTFLADDRLARLARRVERTGSLRIRPVDLSRFPVELRLFYHLYCGAFAGHWGFEPPTWDEFEFIAGDLRHILRPEMTLVAEWRGEPAGFVLGIPDLYQATPKTRSGRLTPAFVARLLFRLRSVDETRVMIAGVLPAYRGKGIHLSLFHRVATHVFDLGYLGGEISWVHVGNDPMEQVLPLLGASRTRTYRVYRMALHQ